MSTILVVEDNELNRDLVTDLLEAHGHNVLTAQDADEGIRLALEHMPHLVLMDLSLPGMDGLEATRTLRADGRTCQITIVALTAHAMIGDEKTALDAGCDGYLTKPIDTRRFVSQVESFLCSANRGTDQQDPNYAL